MRCAGFLLAALALQDPAVLKYGGERGAKVPADLEVSLDLDLKGSDTALDHLRSTSPFFSFSRIHYKASGDRRVASIERKDGGRTLRMDFDEVKIDGIYDDEKYEFEFRRGEAPDDLKEDKLKGLLWMITMNGHPLTVSSDGAAKSPDPNQDAFGEVLMLLAWPTPRLSSKAVKPGESWETAWRGERLDKEHKGKFDFKQKTTLEKVADGYADLAFELSAGVERKEGQPENKVTGKGRATLDTASGLITDWESEGRIVVAFKGTDPGSGEEIDLTITFTLKSRLTARLP